jgi:hypothetical protein
MENFFSHFKAEFFHLYSFRTAEEVKEAVRQYIHFYNHHRFQKKLNSLSPYEYRIQAVQRVFYSCLLDRGHFKIGLSLFSLRIK